MAVNFTELLENAELTEDVKSALQEAWEGKISEAREELTAELREEFAQRYDHDKSQIVEAVDKFISEKVTAEISAIAEEKISLAKDRVKYTKAISEHAKVLDTFVTEMVAKEVKELRADRANTSEHVTKLDNFVAEQLATELSEFHEDKKSLVEQKVKMVREGKKQLAEAKMDFIKKAADKVENVVNGVVVNEVKSFRNDITKARENDFGRRIFEAFANEYGISYMNEAKEIKKVQKQITELEGKLNESKQAIVEKEEAVKLTESKLRVSEDRFARKETLTNLMAPLGKEKKEIMSDLLESVKTEKLEESFNKYLPSVLDGETPRMKKTLSESVVSEHTGDKASVITTEANDRADDIVEIDMIRKLAGLSK
jgi:Mn-dependent DtxR family transcriptional regulator